MTDIADLIEAPASRLAFLMQEFVRDLEEKHRESEKKLDLLIEAQRTRLHRLHLKEKGVYKELYNNILMKLNHDEDAEILEWFEFILKTKRKDLVHEVLERAKPVIQEIEKHGGKLAIDIGREGHGMSGCIYSDPKRSYFSFIDEFLDGFDDEYVYVVKKEQKSKAEREKERDARLEETMAKWRAEEKAKRVSAEEAAAAVAGSDGQLKATTIDEAVASFS